MKTVIVWSGVLGLALAASAQNYGAAINLAHKAVTKTENASNADPDAQPQNGAPPARSAQPMDPALAATLQNISRLRADLNYLSTNSSPGEALTNDLMAASTGTKPSAETVAKVIGDLEAALKDKPALRSHFQKIAQYLHAAANGAHLTPAQFAMISDNLEQILENGGAPYTATEDLLDGLKHLARETK
jgi:glycine/D-amino acid oxidase-like deaminating enzyme